MSENFKNLDTHYMDNYYEIKIKLADNRFWTTERIREAINADEGVCIDGMVCCCCPKKNFDVVDIMNNISTIYKKNIEELNKFLDDNEIKFLLENISYIHDSYEVESSDGLYVVF